jgi:hypothetical protein
MAIHLWISLVYFMSYFPLLCIIFIHCINFFESAIQLLYCYYYNSLCDILIFFFAYNMFEIMQDPHVERKWKKMEYV